MAILAIIDAPGITKAQYESLRPLVNWETQHPAGICFHASAFDDKGGLHVVDVWNSEEELRKFFEGRLMPAMKKNNITPPPPKIYPLHNLNIYPPADRYRTQGK